MMRAQDKKHTWTNARPARLSRPRRRHRNHGGDRTHLINFDTTIVRPESLTGKVGILTQAASPEPALHRHGEHT